MTRILSFFSIIIVAISVLAAIPSTIVDDDNKNKQVRAVAIIDGNGNQVGTSTTGLPVAEVVSVDLEGLGDITVGTSAVEIVISGTTREVRIQADNDNTGIIFIGKTGVLSNKTNDYVRLESGDEHTFPYNDVTNGLFAISDTAAQKINAGTLLQ